MLNPSSPLARLIAAPMRPGQVAWLGVRPVRRGAVRACPALVLDPAAGIEGDHYAGRSHTRQVTLIGAEQLAAIAAFLGRETAAPEALRRNIVVRGINLAALKECRLQIGPALLAITGDCHPRSRMEEIFGPGGYNAVRGHGGLTARVIEGGRITVGDSAVRA